MAFQKATSAASDARRDMLCGLVAMATSQHVASVAVNNGGSGYTVGDVVELTHAGAYHPARFEVTTVSAGAITGLKILDNGAFSNRVASVALVGGGTGYAVGDILRFTGGTYTEFAKIRVDAVTAGNATAISLIETGGAYSIAPGTATSSDVGVGSGTGLTATPTMTGLTGTAALAVTGTATVDIVLVESGWSALEASQNQNNYSVNGIDDEKEVILRGTSSTSNEPLIGIRSYTNTQGINTHYGWVLTMMDFYSPSLAFGEQQNQQPRAFPDDSDGSYLLMFDNAQEYWMRLDGRHCQVVVKAVGTTTTGYNHCYLGLLEPMGTTTEMPYAGYVQGCTGNGFQTADNNGTGVTGPTELVGPNHTLVPAYVRFEDSNWWGVANSTGTTASRVNVVSPLGAPTTMSGSDPLHRETVAINPSMANDNISRRGLGTPESVIMPALGTDEILLWPCTVISTANGTNDTGGSTTNNAYTLPRGDVSGIFWCPATAADGSALVAEDEIVVDGQDHILFQNATRSERYSYFALRRN